MSADDLQARLDQMKAGESLKLDPPRAEFKGPLVIHRAVVIDGQGATIWAAQGPVVSVQTGGVVLRDVNVEVTSRETNLAGEAACALVVAPNQAITLHNVSVRGNVLGLKREEGQWACPRSLALGSLPANAPHEMKMVLSVPVACTIDSEIDGLHVNPRQVQGDNVEVVLRLDPLPAGTRIRGLLKLKTAALIRQINVSGSVVAAANAPSSSTPLWKPDGARQSAAPAPASSTASVPMAPTMSQPIMPQPTTSVPVGTSILVVSQLGDAQFRGIGEAIQHAGSGTRILVRPGIYKESLVLDKRIELVGDGPVSEVVIEAPDSNALRFQAEIAKVRGLTLRTAPGRSGRDRYAVRVLHGQLILEDCDITSDSLACLAVHGPTATPVIRRCKIHHGASVGVLVFDRAEAEFEDCDIFENGLAGLEIRQGGNPTLRGCRIHGGKHVGVLVHTTGRGSFHECDISGNAMANVEIRQGGNPNLRRCKIYDGQSPGVRIHDQGQGTLEDCEIYANTRAGVEVASGGAPVLRRCSIRAGKQSGVLVTKNGQGTFDACDIAGNHLSGVEVRQGSQPALKQCKVHDNQQAGVLVGEKGGGTFEECAITGNGWAGVAIVGEGCPTLRMCKVQDNKLAGIAWRRGSGTVEKCEIAGNALSGVAITEGAHPVVRGCSITGNGDVGVWVHEKGGGAVEDCDLTNNTAGEILLASGAPVRLNRNKLDSN
jgi:hypothetical protein